MHVPYTLHQPVTYVVFCLANTSVLCSSHLQAYADSGFASLQASPIMATTSPTAAQVPQPVTPSNTLFVTNLGPYLLDHELQDLFNSFPGFVRLRMTKQPVQMQTGGQSLCAFVEYTVSCQFFRYYPMLVS